MGITENTRIPSSSKYRERIASLRESLDVYLYRDAIQYKLSVLKLLLVAMEAGLPVKFEAAEEFKDFTRVRIAFEDKERAWWIPTNIYRRRLI